MISNVCTSLTVVLSDSLLTEAVSGEDVAAAILIDTVVVVGCGETVSKLLRSGR